VDQENYEKIKDFLHQESLDNHEISSRFLVTKKILMQIELASEFPVFKNLGEI